MKPRQCATQRVRSCDSIHQVWHLADADGEESSDDERQLRDRSGASEAEDLNYLALDLVKHVPPEEIPQLFNTLQSQDSLVQDLLRKNRVLARENEQMRSTGLLQASAGRGEAASGALGEAATRKVRSAGGSDASASAPSLVRPSVSQPDRSFAVERGKGRPPKVEDPARAFERPPPKEAPGRGLASDQSRQTNQPQRPRARAMLVSSQRSRSLTSLQRDDSGHEPQPAESGDRATRASLPCSLDAQAALLAKLRSRDPHLDEALEEISKLRKPKSICVRLTRAKYKK